MTPPRHDEIEALFIAALDCPPDARDDFVRDACGSDEVLDARVRALLRDHDLAEQAIRAPLEATASLPGLRPGKAVEGHRIGRYTLRRVIATGGMGVVYEAVQDQPHRVVALKIMRPGLLSRSAEKRFEFEAQILARLRHPNIAQVYEAGTHEDATGSMPFFAMEYVPDARPLTEYVRARKLGTRERLELFETVCDAVQHGHRKGVIHRDLKPSNILVDSAGELKIIDFGVARVTNSDMAVTTVQTDVGQLIGTLQYMSPEQCEADPLDLDSRSDVYALGVVLYELLCDRLPYDVTNVAIHEAVRVIRDETPTRPSTIDRALRGDLETIALKALEKERPRRYQGAAELAADVHRYLADEPIEARPASALYQLRKFSRRNRAFVGGVTATAAALVVGTSVATWQAVRAGHEAATATAVKEFLAATIGAADFSQQGHRVTVEQLLDGAVDAISGNFADDPVTEGEVRHLFAKAYKSMSRLNKAETQFQLARERRRVGLGEEHPDTITSAAYLAAVLQDKRLLDEAAELRRWVVDARRRVLGPDHPSTLGSMSRLAITLSNLAEYDEAIEFARDSADGLAETVGPEHVRWFRAQLNLSSVLRSAGRFHEAEAVTRPALAALRRTRGDDDSLTLSMQFELAGVLFGLGDLESAEPLATAALETRRRKFGDDDLQTVTWMEATGFTLFQLGHRERGERMLREGIAGLRRLAGDQLRTGYALQRLALVAMSTGAFDEAVELSLESIRIKIEYLGEGHWHIASARLDLAEVYRNADRLEDAESMMREAVDGLTATVGREHYRTMSGVYRLALVLAQRGDLPSAEPHFREFLNYGRREWPDHSETLRGLNAVAWFMKDGTADQLAYAEELASECVDRCRTKYPQGHAVTADALDTLGVILHVQRRCDEAVKSFDDALVATGREDWAALSLQEYADCLDAVGRLADAAAVRKKLAE